MPLQVVRQDITKMQVDAVVNTTNEKMVGYSGVDLAIHTAAGQALDAACKALAPLALGEAKSTPGFLLPVKHIIHTRGPVWEGGDRGESDALRRAYLVSLECAASLACETVAFPLISAGTYGFPKDKVLNLAIQTIAEFLLTHEMTVYLCVFDRESYALSQKLFEDIEDFIEWTYNDALDTASYSIAFPSERRADERRTRRSPEPQSNVCYDMAGPTAWKLDMGFREMLFKLIDASGMSDVQCYKKANVDKRTFSKIKSQKDYRPSKQTVLAFAIALRLDMRKTQDLLETVGFTLSRSILFDVIVRYFIERGVYDIFTINEALFNYDQVLLGAIS